MAEKIKKYWDIIAVFGIGLVLTILTILGIVGMIGLPFSVSALTQTGTVGVTATVQEWLSFTVSTTSVALSPDLVTTAGGTNIANSTDITLNLGTNAASGWNVTIEGANAGLKHTDGTTLIASVATATTTTLIAGMDPGKYGANASSIITGATVGTYYNYWGTETVGAIHTTAQTLLSKSTANATTNVGFLKIKAAAPSTQKPGTYNDMVTLIATSPT